LIECQVLRYSPAGIALLNARLAHQSEQNEVGIKRQLDFEVDVLFAGEQALRASRLAPGQGLKLAGFIAPKRKLGKALLFHVTDFDVLEFDHE
jgi:primosomal replication protein N